MNEVLKVARRDRTVELTLNRPECRNALWCELVAGLTEALQAAGKSDEVRCVQGWGNSAGSEPR